MRTEDPVSDLSRALGHAEHVGFPEFEEEVPDYSGPRPTKGESWPTKIIKRRPRLHEIQVLAMFPQLWGSTALGFGGIGGAAMTTAYTIVITSSHGDALVYFGGTFAYRVARPNALFFADIAAMTMAPVGENSRYEDAPGAS